MAEFCTHIRRRVGQKPHVLVAYAWCFYMAVFSGGRWIRSELLGAGPDFWTAGTASSGEVAETKEPVRLGERGLSFWSFPGGHDGLDIKEAFKARLLAAETLLTTDERIDIIEEAKTIFTLSTSLVQELDEKLGTDFDKMKQLEAAARQQAAKTGVKATVVTPDKSQSAVMWLRRPEVTGTVVALGCLACVALLRLGY